MTKKFILYAGLSLFAVSATAQNLKDGYVDWGLGGSQLHTALETWKNNKKLNDDDNFFISRVKPKTTFRNVNTQVRTNINESNDKKLIMWVPIDDAADKAPSGTSENALPNGVYDSEVFSMWNYVTHYGNWTAPLGRVPGNFADVAHKNGVAVSGVAGVPWNHNADNGEWADCFEGMYDHGAELTGDFLNYYGNDGLGYNSEWNGSYVTELLIEYHQDLVEYMKDKNPIYENMWYDGTNESGYISFDMGLGTHNDDILKGASLFFNYNWSGNLHRSVEYAKSVGLNPLNIYAGMNMQGGEGNFWKTLVNYPISIGLWGAHSQNMFWESRGEKGSSSDVKQRTYMLRTERWFTGGTRNPVTCPATINSLIYVADNYDFHGVSSMMSARSTLCWDLATEPFITYFNLGNGKFFNWNGVRQHNNEWYNIGIQDYLPTWRWWFASKLLGRTASDVPANGLDAEFTWDDAYMGGSTARIFGSIDKEYLHLFKTNFAVKAGDVVTFRYKLRKGSADVNLLLTANGSESVVAKSYSVNTVADEADDEVWVERKFTVDANVDVALVALEFKNAQNLDLLLGEFSIVRGTAATPKKPIIESASVLDFNNSGVDGKIIFNMPNDKAAGVPCYNIDVNASMFKLYAQQEGCEPILMGATTSWAGLYFAVPMDMAKANKVRFGVSAVSLDMKSESNIAWGAYTNAGNYDYNDEIQISKTTIKPNEEFEIAYIDERHEEGTWTITNAAGATVATGSGIVFAVNEGLPAVGNYTLTLKGYEYEYDDKGNNTGNRIETTRTFADYIQITSAGSGAIPKILSFTANGEDADITVNAGDEIALAYTGRKANGAASRALDLKENNFGAKAVDLGIVGKENFSTAFWIKINKLSPAEGTQLLAIYNKRSSWPKTDWGWLWTTINPDGSFGNYTFRGTDVSSNNELRYFYRNTTIPVGKWVHLAFTFEYNANGGLRSDFYVNGVKQEIAAWNRQNDPTERTTDPGYQTGLYNIENGMMLNVGGPAHGRSGIDGVLDNFQFWNKVMTAEDVQASMGDIDPNNLPAGLAAFWDFEDEADASHAFKSVGTMSGIGSGMHVYESSAGDTEGQGTLRWVAPDYTSGSPFVSGTSYPVITTPEFKANRAVVENIEGDDLAGSAVASYKKGGDNYITLVLSNSLGSDSKTFAVIKVDGGSTGVEGVGAAEVATYVVEGAAVVEFAEAGNYTVNVYTAAGQLVASKAASLVAGNSMNVALGAKGTYILCVEKDGELVRSVKLLNK
ncbi:MAG: hypothetical protein IKJ31_06845 [Bacteroidaceae bacterium]|nr:hypothetical protein [Bacteroidaceae bacterium]